MTEISNHDKLIAQAREARGNERRFGSPGGIAVFAGSAAHREGVTVNPFNRPGEDELARKWQNAWDTADQASREMRETTHCHHTAEQEGDE